LRIGLNLLHALPEIGGGWNYISNLVAALGREDSENEYVAFVTRTSAPVVPQRPNFRTSLIPIRSRVRAQRVLFENSALQALVWRERLQCLHWFANTQGLLNVAPAVVTLYDLQPFLHYTPMSAPKRALLRWQMAATVRRAAVLLPMSQTTATDLEQRLGADPRRMIVVPPVLETVFQPPSRESIDRLRSRYALPSEFWLYVAHQYAHKNHQRLLQAYRALKAEHPGAWPLVLRGDPQPGSVPLQELIARADLAGHVVALPRLDREELPALYGAASALVFPSLYEGAGIPVLEAQACGCPVIASDIPPVREFAGNAVHYMDPHSVTDITRAMTTIAGDPVERERLRQHGLERAHAFRAIPVVDFLLDAYRRACSTAPRQ
jgi:glycosyltransferase involved in cell wall biosynthesis